jgi:predicted DNA-binding protein YlxM (UPF0122 family)
MGGRMKHMGRPIVYDPYWVLCQLWRGYKTKDIILAMGTKSRFALSNLLSRYKYSMLHAMQSKIKAPQKENYGIAEIARELGITRQAVHQKVKACRSPYVDYNPSGLRKKRIKKLSYDGDPVQIIGVTMEYFDEGYNDKFISDVLKIPIAIVRWARGYYGRPDDGGI